MSSRRERLMPSSGRVGLAQRITVRHQHAETVAVIEVVSPGNKAGQAVFVLSCKETADFIRQSETVVLASRGSRETGTIAG